ncbi:MAG: hypothetical protein ACI4R8_01145 [Candidatus Caccovivens sp.]
MDKTGKQLIGFNVKNGQYARKTADGYETPKPFTWLTRFSKEKNLSTKPIYGDGELQVTLVNDKGFTGTIGMTAQDIEYNKDMGFAKDIEGGLAEVKQLSIVEHAIYFETDFCGKDGVTKTKKVWVYGVQVNAPSESFDQNTEDINESNVEYALTIRGLNLKDADGSADYVDAETGQYLKCFTYSKTPTDDGYATFGNTVPLPKIKSAT